MGYRSDVYIGVAFADAEILREVMSVYAMDLNVQKHDAVSEWEVKHDTVLHYYANDVKWYETYSEVKAIEHLMDVITLFVDERDISAAWYFIRLGENEDDVEMRDNRNGCRGDELMHYLFDAMHICRSVDVHFGEPIRGQELK